MMSASMRTAGPVVIATLATFGSTMGGVGELAGQALGVPVALEVRVDAGFPLGDFGDIAGNGIGFAGGVSVGVLPNVGIYGKYSDSRFGGGYFGDGVSDARDSGFAVGLSATLPGTVGVSPWVGGGLLFHRLEVRETRQGVSEDLGFELGAGVALPLSPEIRLTPALNYRRYSATIPALAGIAARDLSVQYLTLGIGLNYTF
jgi:hypothetical protein